MNKLLSVYDLLEGKLYGGEMFDIICISETWLHNDISDSIIIIRYSYDIHRCDRSDGRVGGGVCIITSEKLICSIVEVPKRFNGIEVCCIEITLENTTQRYICVYNPPNYKSDYMQKLCVC